MRPKDKIEKYLDRLIKKHDGLLVESERSRYYSVKGRVLRISDHVGKNSTGNLSIIFDSSDQGNYIVHGHASGNISVLNYEQVKEFVRSFIRTSYLFTDISQTTSANVRTVESSSDETTATKLFRAALTKKQLFQVKSWLIQRGNKKLSNLL
jgi:hypothetical protein